MGTGAQGTSNEDGNKQTSDKTSGAGDNKPDVITMTSAQLAERLARAKPADYDELKAKAARLDEIEAANKSEIDKVREAAEKAQAERDQARAEAMRLRVAAKYGISDEDADLFLTATDEATLQKQAEALAARSDRTHTKSKHGNYVPQEGGDAGTAKSNPLREFARQVFNVAE